MAIKPVLTYPHKSLTSPTSLVTWPLSDETIAAINDVVETMRSKYAFGLAANQIGIDLRICALDGPSVGLDIMSPAMVLINPRIVSMSDTTELTDEECLSLPGLRLRIRRPVHVRIEHESEGQPLQMDLSGMAARAVVHELEHLDGRMLWSSLGTTARAMAKKRWLKLKK